MTLRDRQGPASLSQVSSRVLGHRHRPLKPPMNRLPVRGRGHGGGAVVNAILRVKKIGRARLAAMTQEWEEGCLMFTVTKKATKKKRAQDV